MVVAVVQWSRSAEPLPGTLTSPCDEKETGRAKLRAVLTAESGDVTAQNRQTRRETDKRENPSLLAAKQRDTEHCWPSTPPGAARKREGGEGKPSELTSQ